MDAFKHTEPYPAYLAAELVNSDNRRRIHLVLGDAEGVHGAGVLDLMATPLLYPLPHENHFLAEYVAGRTGATDHLAFGRALHQALLAADPSLARAWTALTASGRPLALTVGLGPLTELFAGLPLELLHDEAGFCFNRPGSSLMRAFVHHRRADFQCPLQPRALFAWACPPGAGDPFDPALT